MGSLCPLPAGHFRFINWRLCLLTVPHRHLRMACWQYSVQCLPYLCSSGVPAVAARKLGRVCCLQALLHRRLFGRTCFNVHFPRFQYNSTSHDTTPDNATDYYNSSCEHHDHSGAHDTSTHCSAKHYRFWAGLSTRTVRRWCGRFVYH